METFNHPEAADLVAGLSLTTSRVVSREDILYGIEMYCADRSVQEGRTPSKVINHFRGLANTPFKLTNVYDTIPWDLLLNEYSLVEVDAGPNRTKRIVKPSQFEETHNVLSVCYDILGLIPHPSDWGPSPAVLSSLEIMHHLDTDWRNNVSGAAAGIRKDR
jgi:hypothetical protein